MKNRAAIHFVLSIIMAVMLVVCATAFQTNYSARPEDWIAAQRQPILWLVDFTAVYTLILMSALSRTQQFSAQEIYTLRQEHQNQLEALIAQAADLEEKNVAQEERIEDLEGEMTETHSVATQAVATASNLLTEAGFRTLQAQIEAQARQLEAVNMALQYHRAELSQLRHGLRALAPDGEIPPMPALPLPESSYLIEKVEPSPVLSIDAPAMPNFSSEPSTENKAESEPAPTEPTPEPHAPTEERKLFFDPTVNARSTIVHEIADFEVAPNEPAEPEVSH
jgi:hypothetical protein